jgi:hypothetical protein
MTFFPAVLNLISLNAVAIVQILELLNYSDIEPLATITKKYVPSCTALRQRLYSIKVKSMFRNLFINFNIPVLTT